MHIYVYVLCVFAILLSFKEYRFLQDRVFSVFLTVVYSST